MLWLKRNIPLVIAIVVGLILAGFGGYFVYVNQAANQELTDKLTQQKQELDRLTTDVVPSPVMENVTLVNNDLKKASEFSLACRKIFTPTPYTPVNSQGYRSTLETTLVQLRRLAAQQGVDVVTNYNFSFEAETKPMSFDPGTIKPLSEQLHEVKEVCTALFAARIHRLELIRRVAVSHQYDTPGSADILPGISVVTNRYTDLRIWPYEFTFETFSVELAKALEEINRLPGMVLIKTITVEPSPNAPPPAVRVPEPPPQPPAGGGPGMPPGRRLPGGVRPGGVAAAAVAPKIPSLTTVLEERLLKVTLLVHIIKPEK